MESVLIFLSSQSVVVVKHFYSSYIMLKIMRCCLTFDIYSLLKPNKTKAKDLTPRYKVISPCLKTVACIFQYIAFRHLTYIVDCVTMKMLLRGIFEVMHDPCVCNNLFGACSICIVRQSVLFFCPAYIQRAMFSFSIIKV